MAAVANIVLALQGGDASGFEPGLLAVFIAAADRNRVSSAADVLHSDRITTLVPEYILLFILRLILTLPE